MPSSFGRSIVIAVFVFVLTVSPYAHAAQTTTVGINDPVADMVQLWTAALSSIETLSQQLASVLQPQPSLTFDRSAKQPAPNNSPQPAALAASAALATQPLPETATTSGSVSGTPPTSQQPQSQNAPAATSHQTTQSPFVKLPGLSEVGTAVPSSQTSATFSATPATAFVTQSQFNAAFSNRLDPLIGIVGDIASILPSLSGSQIPTPQQVAGNGNPEAIGAGAAINQLNNVTITNANLTASEIPPLDYLSLSGGSLSGDLSVTGNATTTGTSYFSGNVGIGTSSSQDALSVNGSTYLTNIASPSITANRLYANSGSLYWAGSVIAGAATGNWTSDGTNVWRTGGSVGIGTTTPTALLTLDSSSPTGTIMRVSNSSAGGHIYDWLSTGSGNTGGAGRLDLFDDTADAARLSIASNGNVGIGSTSPAALLTVVGTIAQSIGGQQPFTPPYQSTPVTTGFSTAGAYNDSSSGNIFHLSSYAQNSGSAPTVAVFGEGVSNGSGSAWGGNFVGYSNSATANAQGVEIDYGVLTNGGTATGLLVAGAGNFAPSTAIQIQSNNTNAIPANGINFHYRSAQGTNPASNSLIETSGAVSLPLGIDFSSATFSSAAIKLPSSTASSSGIAFGADTDFYRTAANTLATDGGFRAGGSVAIGTTTSPTHALEVAGGTAGAETELLELWSPYNNGNTATGISFVNNSTEGALSGGAQIAAIRGTSGSSNLVFRVANTSSVLFEAMRVTSSGNVGIGTTTPYSRLEVWGPDSGASTTAFLVANSASSTLFYVSDNGNAVLQGGLTQTSDQRLKTNIQSLDASSSLSLIDQLNPVTFNWIDPNRGYDCQARRQSRSKAPDLPSSSPTTAAVALTPDGDPSGSTTSAASSIPSVPPPFRRSRQSSLVG